MARILNIRQLQRIAKKVGRKNLHIDDKVKKDPFDGYPSFWCVMDYWNQEFYHLDIETVSMDQLKRCCGFENVYYGDGSMEQRAIEYVTPFTKALRCAAWGGWYFLPPSKRKCLLRHGVNSAQVSRMHEVHESRWQNRLNAQYKSHSKKVHEILEYFSSIPYEYQGDGWDDFNKYQRPASNGIGWVAICPGERGNNYYTDDPVAVAILRRKYDAWVASKKFAMA